jgi:hypothetical protein
MSTDSTSPLEEVASCQFIREQADRAKRFNHAEPGTLVMFRLVKSWIKKKVRTVMGTGEAVDELRGFRDQLKGAETVLGERLGAIETSLAQCMGALETVLLDRLGALETVLRECGPSAAHGGLPAESLQQLGSKGLFIHGCARSGTTILTKSLNASPDILLLEEPNFFQNQHWRDFATLFNRMHEAIGNSRYKGTYIPPPIGPEAGPLEMLWRLSAECRYVGGKVAIGPHDYPAGWQRMYLDFDTRYFSRSHRLLLVRRPAESIWSMHKMFPDRAICLMFSTWLNSLAVSLDFYRTCGNSRWVFFEDLGPPLIGRLAQLLDVPIPVARGTFSPTHIHSHLCDATLPAPLAPYAGLCGNCHALYEQLRGAISSDTMAYDGATNEWEFFDAMRRRIQQLLDRLAEPPQNGH